MFSVIFHTSMFGIFLIVMYITGRTAAKANGRIILGVSLPHNALTNSDTIGIVNKYRRANALNTLVFAVLAAPVLFIADYWSLAMLYMFVWLCAFLYVFSVSFRKNFSELYSLKRKNEWWVGERNVISIDTEVSRLKDTFTLSKNWFALPFVISMVPVVVGVSGNQGTHFWTMTGIGLFNFAVIFFINFAIGTIKSKTHSDNTEINIALNHVFKREWSKCCVLMAIMTSIIYTTMAFVSPSNMNEPVITTVYAALIGFAIIVPVSLSYVKIRTTRNKMLFLENETIYTDDDEYWQSGMYYNNPNDSNTFVEKRVGIGMTVNVATKGGKILLGSIIPAIVLWVGISIYMLPLDFGSVSMEITGQSVTINAPLNTFTFSVEDITSITKIDEFPNAVRAGGSNHPRLYSGRFRVTGYGLSYVFIHANTAPYIAVELIDGWVFFNGRAPNETVAFYYKLSAFLPLP